MIRELAISRKCRSIMVEDLMETYAPRTIYGVTLTPVLENVSQCKVENFELQMRSEVKKIELEKQNFLFKKNRLTKEYLRLKRIQEIAKRRNNLEESRFEREAKYCEESSYIKQEERQRKREREREMTYQNRTHAFYYQFYLPVR